MSIVNYNEEQMREAEINKLKLEILKLIMEILEELHKM